MWSVISNGALPHNSEACQGREASCDVHHYPSGEVPDTPLAHPATAPNPMAEWRVDHYHPQWQEDEICLEAESVCESSRHQHWCYDCKHALIRHEEETCEPTQADMDAGSRLCLVDHQNGKADFLREPRQSRSRRTTHLISNHTGTRPSSMLHTLTWNVHGIVHRLIVPQVFQEEVGAWIAEELPCLTSVLVRWRSSSAMDKLDRNW